jgi:hypothetical protein
MQLLERYPETGALGATTSHLVHPKMDIELAQ